MLGKFLSDNLGVEPTCFGFELNLSAFPPARPTQMCAIPRYPAITRDVSFFVDADVPAARVSALIQSAGESLLESISVLEDYRDAGKVPDGKKGMYMGYANIPQGIGWGLGSWFAGQVYDDMGDKANLALRYMADNNGITGIDRTEAMNKLVEVTGKTHQEATDMLWAAYKPYELWYSFAAVGVASALLMLVYAKWVKKHEASDV